MGSECGTAHFRVHSLFLRHGGSSGLDAGDHFQARRFSFTVSYLVFGHCSTLKTHPALTRAQSAVYQHVWQPLPPASSEQATG